MLSGVEADESPNHMKQLDILLKHRSVDFAMNGERDKLRMKETTNELESLIPL